MPVADIDRLQKMVASTLNANPDDMSYAIATTDQDKYSPDHIKDAILTIDLEVIRTIQETPGHGYRPLYGSYTLVSNGASIPGHSGKVGGVEIRRTSQAPLQRGIRVESIDVINKLQLNPGARYGSTAIAGQEIWGGYYYIDEDMRLYFTGYTAYVFTPTVLDRTGFCQCTLAYEPTIFRGSISLLAKDPVDPTLSGAYLQAYERDLALIRAGGAAVPPLDSFVKAGG